ncbi:MAG: PDZ domain-containing protein, partial [Anaerolineae bacterium]|nr:PDZ domain-containing protein [Anaerolineae bacterium]
MPYPRFFCSGKRVPSKASPRCRMGLRNRFWGTSPHISWSRSPLLPPRPAMNPPPEQDLPPFFSFLRSTGFQVAFSLVTLCILLFYNLAYYIFVPVTGVWLDFDERALNTAVIDRLNPGGPGEKAGLRVGDVVLSIDGRPIRNLNMPVHQPKKAGEIEIYTVRRGEVTQTIALQVGRYGEHPDYLLEIVPLQVLSILIFTLGLAILLFSRPENLRARLVGVVWALGGVVITTTGPGYISCAWFAPEISLLIFTVSIVLAPAAHLVFPATTFSPRVRRQILSLLGSLALVLATAYLSQQVFLLIRQEYPRTTPTALAIKIGFYLAALFSIGLLLKNTFLIPDREARRQTGIIFWGTLAGFTPYLFFSELPSLVFGPHSEWILLPKEIGILFMAVVPLAYAYVIYQRRLLKIDFLINRILVLLLTTLGVLVVSIAVLSAVSIPLALPSRVAVTGSFICLLITLPSAVFQRRVQILVDRVLYGSHYDAAAITAEFSRCLAQTLDRPAFIHLLVRDLPQKMKVQQAALLMLDGDSLELQDGQSAHFSALKTDQVCRTLAANPNPTRAQDLWAVVGVDTRTRWRLLDWAQLFVPIFHRGTLYGILILGDRQAGEIYSNRDVQLAGTISQQAALTIANIFLVEAMRGLSRQLVRSDEEQRKKVARDLHDSVLQNLFFVKQQVSKTDPEASALVDRSITMLRQTIKSQRPSLLDQGLALALNDLVSDMQRLAGDTLLIRWRNALEEEVRLPDEQAT